MALDVKDKVVHTRSAAGHDYSLARASPASQVSFGGFTDQGFGRDRVSDYDFLWSDNYKYAAWDAAYKVNTQSVLAGSILTAVVAVLYIWQCYYMTRHWRAFIGDSPTVLKSRGLRIRFRAFRKAAAGAVIPLDARQGAALEFGLAASTRSRDALVEGRRSKSRGHAASTRVDGRA